MHALFCQERHDLRGRDQKGEAFIELLLIAWERLNPSDKKIWEAQAQEIDDAEFTALLDEEWEKLSAKEQENAASEARVEIKPRDQEAAKKKEAATEKKQGNASNDEVADKQVWVCNKKALAKEMEKAQKKSSEGSRNKNNFLFRPQNSTPQSATKDSEAFKHKVRVACRCTVSGGLCLATDNYRSLAL